MIRPATFADMPRLIELVQAMHESSIYPARNIGVDMTSARAILMDGIRRHGGGHQGSTLFNVVEFRGQVEGYMLGILQRIYSIGNRLEAQDFWLFCTNKAPKIASGKLVDAYIEWADTNPKVADIALSWTNAAKVDGRKIARLYERKGFDRVGEIYKRASR